MAKTDPQNLKETILILQRNSYLFYQSHQNPVVQQGTVETEKLQHPKKLIQSLLDNFHTF